MCRSVREELCDFTLFFSSSRLCECACMCILSWKECCRILPCTTHFQCVFETKYVQAKDFLTCTENNLMYEVSF